MANNHPFPPELQALALDLSIKEREHNELTNAKPDAFAEGEHRIRVEMAFRERVNALGAFNKALDAYLESCRGR